MQVKSQYEVVRDQIVRKSFLTEEDRFFLGTEKGERILESNDESIKGKIRTTVDILLIKDMIKKKHSVVDVMEKFEVSRDTVCKIIGIEPYHFAPALANQQNGIKKRGCIRFKPERLEEILAEYSKGIPTNELARRYCTSQHAIRYLLKKNGVEMDHKHKRLSHLIAEEKSRIDYLYAKGFSSDRIARETGIDIGQVRRYIKKVFGK